jgi:uncharacterized protein (UPF0332 family)
MADYNNLVQKLQEKSNECLKTAEYCHTSSKYNCAASRYYYSLFQLVYAIALKTNKITPNATGYHRPLLKILKRELIDDYHQINDDVIETFNTFLDNREDADYHEQCITNQMLKREETQYRKTRDRLVEILNG